MQIALKCADISNPCRPWDISKNWSFKVCEEFFRQGDYERELNLPVSALCDKNNISVPKIQIGFSKYIVTPLIKEWHRFLQNDLSTQMLDNLLSNQNKWERLIAMEVPEENPTEAPDTDVAEDNIESGSGLSDSSELLLPGRRSSLNPIKPRGFKEQLRRFSVPLNIFQERKIKRHVKSRASASSSEMRRDTSRLDIEFSIRSQQCSPKRGKRATFSTEKYLSTENLLQVDDADDDSYQQIPTSEITFLECLLASRHLHKSAEDTRFSPPTTKSDFLQRLENLKATRFRWFKKSEAEKSDQNEASTSGTATQEGGRREKRGETALAVGSRLRDNLSAVTLDGLHPEQLTPRRKSMPADSTSATAGALKEKKVLDLAAIQSLRKHAESTKEEGRRRRGSAPVPVAVSELRGLAQSAQGAQGARASAPTGTRKKPSAVASCQQWLARAANNAQEKSLSNIPRRSSLPIEVMTGSAYQ